MGSMVNLDLVNQSKDLLGDRPRKILVTGATGFVGRHLAETLTRAGQDVIATGRNRYLAPTDTPFVPVDIRNPVDVARVCDGQEIVIHCASDNSPWGPYAKLAATNVQGTENIVNACRQRQISRLVHVSSTAIQFGFRDALDVTENQPLPNRFSCNYAKSKYFAEKVVQSACDQGMNAIIVRARAVYGPRDQNLLPRLLEVYDQGRLRQIGDGTNITDLTYIDNLVYALVLAIDNGTSGEIVTVTGAQPIDLWNLVHRVLKATGRNGSLRRIPYSVASSLASLSEASYFALRKKQEPPLTRYKVGLLAKNQTFNIEAARRELNYKPVVSQEDGIQRTIEALTAKSDCHSSVPVQLRLFTTGYTPIPLHLAQKGADREKVAFHATFALISHPRYGLTLFDTGYSPRFYDATAHWPYNVYAKLTPVVTSSEQACVNVLRKAKFDPGDVKRIVLSHFHADHTGGLRDFPNADIIASSTAWNSVAGKSGLRALRHAFLPELLPDDIKERLFLLPSFVDPGIGPFAHTHDLFADGSVRLVQLPGHAKGQIGALIQSGFDERSFLVADAVWTRETITENLPLTLAFKAFADNSKNARSTLNKLREFHKCYPDVELIPTHCRSLAAKYHFDAEFDMVQWSQSSANLTD